MKKYLCLIFVTTMFFSNYSAEHNGSSNQSLIGDMCRIFIESFMRAAGKVVGQRVIGNFINYTIDNLSAMLQTRYEVEGDTCPDALKAIKKQRRFFAASGVAMVGGGLSALLLHEKAKNLTKYAQLVKYGKIGSGIISLAGLCGCIFLLNRVPVFRARSEQELRAFYQAGGPTPFNIVVGTPESPVLLP